MKLLKSKILSLIALLLVVIVIVLTFRMRDQWWMFIDMFCAFMMTFCHFAALLLEKVNPFSSKKLDIIALVFGVLFVISFIVEFFIFQAV